MSSHKLSIMKKFVIGLFILGIAIPTFAGLKPKDVAGTWTYEITMDGQTISGTMKFEKDGKELSGEVITMEGYNFPMTKVEIRDDNVLYFEMEARDLSCRRGAGRGAPHPSPCLVLVLQA